MPKPPAFAVALHRPEGAFAPATILSPLSLFLSLSLFYSRSRSLNEHLTGVHAEAPAGTANRTEKNGDAEEPYLYRVTHKPILDRPLLI